MAYRVSTSCSHSRVRASRPMKPDHAGLRLDPCGYMLNEGTEKRDSKHDCRSRRRSLRRVGVGASDEQRWTRRLSANALDQHTPSPMLGLLAEIARSANFPEKEDRAREGQCAAEPEGRGSATGLPRRTRHARKPSTASTHMRGRRTPRPRINAITRDKLLVCVSSQRLRPEQALLVVTGRIDKDAAFKLATKITSATGRSRARPLQRPRQRLTRPSRPSSISTVRAVCNRPCASDVRRFRRHTPTTSPCV
jgi:hypothetical protein